MYDMLYTFKGSSAKHTASISDYNSTEGYASPKCQTFGPEANTSHYIRNQYRVYSEVWLLGYRECFRHANSHKQHQETTINHNYQFQHK